MKTSYALVGTVSALALGLSGCASESAATGAITVNATNSKCTLSATDLEAGPRTFRITNNGSKVTEFYLYASGDRIVGEVENVGPGLSRNLVVDLPKGTYQGACKPGMVGDGIRQTITVTGSAAKELSDSAELKAAADSYHRFVQSQTGALIQKTTEFVAAVKAGKVDEAKALFPVARTYWERIEPVAETFGDLDPITDGRINDVEPGQDFTGWHRIEKQLWESNNTTGMDKYADQLLANVKEIVKRSKTAPLTALELAQGTKGLLDEVATTKITGEEDAYSHTDLSDFRANIDGSEAALAALRPVLIKRDKDLVAKIDAASKSLDTLLNQYQKADGTWTSYDKLTKPEIKALSDAVAALSEPISKVAAVVAKSA